MPVAADDPASLPAAGRGSPEHAEAPISVQERPQWALLHAGLASDGPTDRQKCPSEAESTRSGDFCRSVRTPPPDTCPVRRRRTALAALAAAALAAALAGCAAPAAPTTPVEPPPLTGTFGQSRSQVEPRLAGATLTLAEGAAPVRVTALQLLVPGFTPAGATAKDTRFEAGRAIALPAPYGEPECAADTAGRPVEAVVTVAGADEPVRVVLDDPSDRAGGLRERECAAQRVAQLAPLAWQEAWTTAGTGPDLVSVGRLDVGPVTGDAPVTVEALGTTTLFGYEAALPVTVAPGERATVEVRLVPARCDPHAVAEDKQGFAPPVALRVGDEELTARAWVPLAQRQVALDALSARCAWP